jgi:hypothetical protein
MFGNAAAVSAWLFLSTTAPAGRCAADRPVRGLTLRRRFVEHTVSIAGFFVDLEIAARMRSDLRILERAEILEDAPKTKRVRQVRVEASIRLDGVLKRNAVMPDALFGLRFNDDEESYFMLEVDLGRDAGRAL